jgi:hypothetical protein
MMVTPMVVTHKMAIHQMAMPSWRSDQGSNAPTNVGKNVHVPGFIGAA